METTVIAKYATGFYNVKGELDFMTWELNPDRAEREFLDHVADITGDEVDMDELLDLGWQAQIIKLEPAPMKEQANIIFRNRR